MRDGAGPAQRTQCRWRELGDLQFVETGQQAGGSSDASGNAAGHDAEFARAFSAESGSRFSGAVSEEAVAQLPV